MTRRWSLHFCPLDSHCRQFDAPARLTIGTPWGSLDIALTWGARTQLWLPWKTRGPLGELSNYTRWWVPIAWHPARKQHGDNT
jgi:hypothetical protein